MNTAQNFECVIRPEGYLGSWWDVKIQEVANSDVQTLWPSEHLLDLLNQTSFKKDYAVMQVFGSNFVLELLSVSAIRQQNREERSQS